MSMTANSSFLALRKAIARLHVVFILSLQLLSQTRISYTDTRILTCLIRESVAKSVSSLHLKETYRDNCLIRLKP
jgi:hypothetical protein